MLALRPWTSQEQQEFAARYHWPPSTAQEQAESYKQLILKAQAAVQDMQAVLSQRHGGKRPVNEQYSGREPAVHPTHAV